MASPDTQGMLGRGLSVLNELGNHAEGLSLSELARAVNLPVSTVHRLLVTLVDMGFASLDRTTKRYRLGVRVFELSHRVGLVHSLSEAAVPAMRSVSEQTGETTQLAVLSGLDTIFVERVDSDHAIAIRGRVGQREPSYCTSTGKVLLSQLDDAIREDTLGRLSFRSWTKRTITDADALRAELRRVSEHGYAIADEEYDEGVRAMAVPVKDGRGRTIAALCISAPAFRTDLDRLLAHLPVLQMAAREIGSRLVIRPGG